MYGMHKSTGGMGRGGDEPDHCDMADNFLPLGFLVQTNTDKSS